MNWLVRTVIDGYRSLTQRIYARRYGTLAKQLGESAAAATHVDEPGRGFIVIQVDGLAHDHLVQVLARGGAPYIKRLIGMGRLRLTSWHSGLPSTTPAVQAGIMFGRNWDIPGFRWFDKSFQAFPQFFRHDPINSHPQRQPCELDFFPSTCIREIFP